MLPGPNGLPGRLFNYRSSFWFVWRGDMLLWQWSGVLECHVVEDAASHHNAAHLFGSVEQHTPSPVQAAPPSLQQADCPLDD